MGIRRQGCILILAVTLLVFGDIFFNNSIAAPPVAVVYPETSRPLSTIFDEIIKGVQDAAKDVDIARYCIDEQANSEKLQGFLDNTNPAAVITLGRTPYQLYQALPKPRPIQIVGALDATPDTHPGVQGIGLDVDPELLFIRLKSVNPSIKRVLVVYNPHRDAQTINIATESARSHGLTLRAYSAQSLSESSAHFENIFNYSNPQTDALWLTIDTNLINERVNLPRIIEQSWLHRMVVFSTSLMHADKGVLFALYPDPYALGKRLFVLSQQDTQENASIHLLSDVKSALNKRMADHLNLNITTNTLQQFDLHLEGH